MHWRGPEESVQRLPHGSGGGWQASALLGLRTHRSSLCPPSRDLPCVSSHGLLRRTPGTGSEPIPVQDLLTLTHDVGRIPVANKVSF